MSSWFNPKSEKRTSPIQGRGLFAREAISGERFNAENASRAPGGLTASQAPRSGRTLE